MRREPARRILLMEHVRSQSFLPMSTLQLRARCTIALGVGCSKAAVEAPDEARPCVNPALTGRRTDSKEHRYSDMALTAIIVFASVAIPQAE